MLTLPFRVCLGRCLLALPSFSRSTSWSASTTASWSGQTREHRLSTSSLLPFVHRLVANSGIKSCVLIKLADDVSACCLIFGMFTSSR